MKLNLKVDKADKFSVKEKEEFIRLLRCQNQIDKPSIEKIDLCKQICLVYLDDVAVGIGAIKQVYKRPFHYAECLHLESKYNIEIGYIYVDKTSSENNCEGLGLGTLISKALLKEVKNENVFATTEYNDSNPMKHIIEKLGFKKVGIPYNGRKTQKTLALYVNNLK